MVPCWLCWVEFNVMASLLCMEGTRIFLKYKYEFISILLLAFLFEMLFLLFLSYEILKYNNFISYFILDKQGPLFKEKSAD